ncbi:MAG TPA: DUF2157 domain-containing protein [Bacillota bacterium]|nr:DUF2157 domain-containing protein [Bacillota bacterium]
MIGVTLVLLLALVGVGLYGYTTSQNGFRRRLAVELKHWEDETILTSVQAGQLRSRYRLDQLASESQSLILKTLFILGALLIAGGVIAFVAAHWEAIPKLVKLAMLVILLTAAHGSGYYLWKVKGSSPYLGHALVILGSFIFAAAIGLVSQMFHLSTTYYTSFLIWSIGVAAMAYAVGSAPQLILAAIASLGWYFGWLGEYPASPPWYLLLFFPVFLPFCFKFASRGSHFTTLLIWGAAVLVFMVERNQSGITRLFVVATILLGMLYWIYSNLHWLTAVPDGRDDVKVLSGCLLGGISYLLSFHEVTRELLRQSWLNASVWQYLVGGALLLFTMVLCYWRYYRRVKSDVAAADSDFPVIAGVSGIILITLLLPTNAWIIGTILANLSVMGFGVFFFRFGLEHLDRRYFWLGLLLLVLLIVGRFFEYETGLLLKSMAFILVGLLLITGGLWFERRKGRDAHV